MSFSEAVILCPWIPIDALALECLVASGPFYEPRPHTASYPPQRGANQANAQQETLDAKFDQKRFLKSNLLVSCSTHGFVAKLSAMKRQKKRASEMCSHEGFRLQCAVSEGRVNPDIFREVSRVKFLRKRMWRRRQKHGNSGTHPAAPAAPGVNCCLETKQRSSLFFSSLRFLSGS